jgi:hypothetical protein
LPGNNPLARARLIEKVKRDGKKQGGKKRLASTSMVAEDENVPFSVGQARRRPLGAHAPAKHAFFDNLDPWSRSPR